MLGLGLGLGLWFRLANPNPNPYPEPNPTKAAVDDLTRAIKLRPPPPRLLLGEALLCRGQLEG